MNCCKCNDKTLGAQIHHWGKTYAFCNYCFEKIESAPKNTTHLQDYLSMDKKSWIDRNMRLAKEKRKNSEYKTLFSSGEIFIKNI